ncbi:MAG TPA: tetratricopeptide repeat protein, partial [Halioglobus sp.]
MNTASLPHKLLSVLLLSGTLCGFPAWGQDVEPVAAGVETPDTLATASEATPPAPADTRHEERVYQEAIAELESSEGAYAQGLTESLLSLARTLQSQGRHPEAIKLFRRGVHLARVNEGLYCPQQIPLLQAEIASAIAVQDYAAADERYKYLYRVQMHNFNSSESGANALMEQAQWQHHAYQLGLGPQGYTRLMDMLDLYQLALQEVISREGEKSPGCLPPLQGILQAQYLISSYAGEDLGQVFYEDGRVNEPLLRFKAYRADSYAQGNAAIQAISGIDQGNPVRNLVMLGDWQLWNGRTDAAWEAYRQAETELAKADDAQTQMQNLFGEPVALPDLANLSPLPPMVDPQVADILLSFGVSEQGRVQDL